MANAIDLKITFNSAEVAYKVRQIVVGFIFSNDPAPTISANVLIICWSNVTSLPQSEPTYKADNIIITILHYT